MFCSITATHPTPHPHFPSTTLCLSNDWFGPLLIGEDPTAINRCLAKMATLVEPAHPARAGIEIALWDIAGKAAGLPVRSEEQTSELQSTCNLVCSILL